MKVQDAPPELFALLNDAGTCQATKFTKDMLEKQAVVGQYILSYKLIKIERVGLAMEPPI